MTKTTIVTLGFGLILGLVSILGAAETPAPKNLFANTSLDAWDFHLDGGGKKDETFTFKDGVLCITGKPNGWICTKEEYKNFRVSVEYRWTPEKEPTNSGIFLRINGEPVNFLPRGIEIQLKHGNGGDLYGFHGMKVSGEAERGVENLNHELVGELRGVKRQQGNEKPAGEWNAVTILCNEGLLVVWWNGRIVNWAHNTEPTAGKLGFQSEGGPIEFRAAQLEVLP